jgi:hypothetical protein
MGIFKAEPTLTELQDEDETLETKVSIARKRRAIRELEGKYGKGWQKDFSDNGKRSGINWMRVFAWLKAH